MAPNYLEATNMEKNLGNANVEEAKENVRKKIEEQIWLAVPTKQLYRRQEFESELLKKANADRFAKYDPENIEKEKNKAKSMLTGKSSATSNH